MPKSAQCVQFDDAADFRTFLPFPVGVMNDWFWLIIGQSSMLAFGQMQQGIS